MQNDSISQHLQDSLVYLAITDTSFAKIIGGQVEEDLLYSEVAKVVYKISVEYVKKFGEAAGSKKGHFHDEIVKASSGLAKTKRKLLAEYVKKLQDMPPPDRDYVLSRINAFVRSRALVNATYKFAEQVEAGNFDEAEKLMYQALRSGLEKQTSGLEYFTDFESLKDRGQRPQRLVNLNILELDPLIWISKGELVAIAGSYKGQKSWFGHHIAASALKLGLDVLHITHENSEEQTEIRYDMMFGGLLNEPRKREITIKYLTKDDRLRTAVLLRDTVYNKRRVVKARKSIYKYGGRLKIKKFPAGTCTAGQIDSLLDYCENFEDFKPVLVINDYADLMKITGSFTQERHSINKIYLDLKAIADQRGCAIVTMSQINEEGLLKLIKTGKFEGRFLAEDKRKFGNIDKGFYVGTPPSLKRYNEAVVGCFANRNGPDGMRCVIGQNLDIGRFCMYSTPFRKEVFKDKIDRVGHQRQRNTEGRR